MKKNTMTFDLKKSSDEGKLLVEKEYNSEGNLVSERTYSNFGNNIVADWVFRYENGQLTEKKWNSNNPEAERFIYEYDEKGKLIKELWYNKPVFFGIGYEDGSPIIKNYNYNSEGLLVEKTSDHRDVGFYERWIYEYDESHNLTREIGIKSTGEIQQEVKFVYDNFNNLIVKEEFVKGRLNNKFTYEYDENNKLISKKEHCQMMAEEKYEYENDEQVRVYIYEYGQNQPVNVIKTIWEK